MVELEKYTITITETRMDSFTEKNKLEGKPLRGTREEKTSSFTEV